MSQGKPGRLEMEFMQRPFMTHRVQKENFSLYNDGYFNYDRLDFELQLARAVAFKELRGKKGWVETMAMFFLDTADSDDGSWKKFLGGKGEKKLIEYGNNYNAVETYLMRVMGGRNPEKFTSLTIGNLGNIVYVPFGRPRDFPVADFELLVGKVCASVTGYALFIR